MVADQEILTVKEVCEILQIHPNTLYKMIRRGQIPAFRMGSDWRFRKILILRWMTELLGDSQKRMTILGPSKPRSAVSRRAKIS